VTLTLLPAVDVAGGQAVRLVQGAAGSETGYGDPLEAALALTQRAMAGYVDAVGLVRTPARRALAAELLTADAQNAAILLARLGRDPLESAFPDGRAA
jgi:phosphoribosylformimino-5-aminoimidazole carboxamide ribonucleotide (ProFAR) isomerase